MLVSYTLGHSKNLRLRFCAYECKSHWQWSKDLPDLFFYSKGKPYPMGQIEPKHTYVTKLICFVSDGGATSSLGCLNCGSRFERSYGFSSGGTRKITMGFCSTHFVKEKRRNMKCPSIAYPNNSECCWLNRNYQCSWLLQKPRSYK